MFYWTYLLLWVIKLPLESQVMIPWLSLVARVLLEQPLASAKERLCHLSWVCRLIPYALRDLHDKDNVIFSRYVK